MATYSSRPLDQIFGDVAQSQVDPYKKQRALGRSKVISGDAASGRLSSGVASADLGLYDEGTAQGEAAIRAGILPAEAQQTMQDRQNEYLSNEADKEYERNMTLSKLLGSMNKPSRLSQIFQGAGSGASTGAAFGPYGALIGGVAGGAAGAFS